MGSQGPTDTAAPVFEPGYLRHEIHSESTLPLLSFLLRERPDTAKRATQLFHEVIRGIGEDKRPIPDESVQVEPAMIELMDNGPSGKNTKIPGEPTVRKYHSPLRMSTCFGSANRSGNSRSPLSEPAPQGCAPGTS